MGMEPGFDAAQTELRQHYRRLCDEELEQLLSEFDDLLDDAKTCLIAELKSRGRTEEILTAAIDAGRRRRLPLTAIDGVDLALTKEIGSVSSFNGIGRIFYGKNSFIFNEAFAFEEFDTTLWWICFWIPFVSRGCFRIRRRRDRPHIPGSLPTHSFVIIRRLSFL